MQSIVVFGALTVMGKVLPIILLMFGLFMGVALLSQLIGYTMLALWILLMIKAYQGERFKLPIAGNIAEQMSK